MQESLGVNLGSTLNPTDDFVVRDNSTYQTTQKDVAYISLGKLTNTGMYKLIYDLSRACCLTPIKI